MVVRAGCRSLVRDRGATARLAGETRIRGVSTVHRKNVFKVIWKAAMGQSAWGKASWR